MANENQIKIIPNPDNVPGSVVSGYQQQNANLFVLQTGLDTTEPFDNGSGVITIPAGGVVEVNGVMFRITQNITLSKGYPKTAYWVAITDNGDGSATAIPVTRPGAWVSAKKGFYTELNVRTLNWVSLGDINNTNNLTKVFEREAKGEALLFLKRGWYYVQMQSGKGGDDGGHANSSGVGRGGVPGSTSYKTVNKIFFFSGVGSIGVKVGGDGGPGGDGQSGGYGVNGGGNGGSGGGGGGGRGEETALTGERLHITTGVVPGGNGGNGSGGGGGGGGGAGEIAGIGGIGGLGNYGAGSPGGVTAGGAGCPGGPNGGGSGGGGPGGNMGADGDTRPDGDTNAGYCRVYRVTD